ncbi:MAG: hypothetical protein ACK40X_03710, partial [Armatimonadota bacterium]
MVRKAFLASVLAFCTFANGWNEHELPKVKQVIVVLCDGLTLQSLEKMGEPVTTMLKEGAIGLLSGASLELSGREGVFVTLGSGRRAKASEQAELGNLLMQNGKSFRLDGDGILKAIVGKGNEKAGSEKQPDVLFVAVEKSSLLPTLKKLMKRLDGSACLWLVVPNSHQTDWLNRRLTPILLFGEAVPSGLLTSPTTRKVGLVSSVDFAPTLLEQLGIHAPASMTGKPMTIVTEFKDRLAYLRWLDERSVKPLRDLKALTFVIAFVTVLAVALTVFATIAPTLSRRPQRAFNFLVQASTFFVLAGMSIPVLLFLVGQMPNRSSVISALWLLVCICLLSLASLLLAKRIDRICLSDFPVSLKAAGLVCAFSAIVALLGVPLYWATPLGHYPTTGWRYFGITNSGIGLALAGTIFTWKLLSLPNRSVALWLLFSPLLMGFSLWGANFGGALTLAIGFTAAWQMISHQTSSWRKITTSSVIAALLTLIALSVIESFIPTDQKAHFGQLLQRMQFFGFAALTDMVQRKLTILLEFFFRTPLNFFALSVFIGFHYAVIYLAQRLTL